ncbi:MAG: hypothetical protein M3O71_04605 [Bacteroidota bacterium]|nr:hypothetical protein [Bacteroidota bacterium]
MEKDKKDIWDRLQAVGTACIPLIIAIVGWLFTNNYNESQAELQKIAFEKQNEVQNSQVQLSQAQLIRDLTQQLASNDKTVRDIALAAIIYSAPNLGKQVADIESKKDAASAALVQNLYDGKRIDVITGLFSTSAQSRLSAYNQIINNWLTDDQFLADLIVQSKRLINTTDTLQDRNNGLYNAMVVFQNYSPVMLLKHKADLADLISSLPSSNSKTKDQGQVVLKSIGG